jgi:hypothetical protein
MNFWGKNTLGRISSRSKRPVGAGGLFAIDRVK